MNLINLLIQDVVKFAADNNLDLNFIVKLIDYQLASIKLNIENSNEVETYINNIRILNTLFILLGLVTNLSDQERTAYDNNTVMGLLDNPTRIPKYKAFKLNILKKYFESDVIKIEEYLELEN